MRAVVVAAAALAFAPAASAGDVFLLDGRGWGHGVGMSQWGAQGFAQHGWGYQRILAHYYQGTRLERTTPRPVRVLLREQQGSVRIGSPRPFRVSDGRGKSFRLGPRGYVLDNRLQLRAEGELRTLVPPLRFTPGLAPVTLGGEGYRGELIVKRRTGKLMVVNKLPLDRYLRGVVPREMPEGWHREAYRAQAVVARSYALATLRPSRDWDLVPTTAHQVYGGIRAETRATNLAIGATAGKVLTWGGRVIPAYYHSTSGGPTAFSRDIWGTDRPYLRSVPSPYEGGSPHFRWPTRAFTREALARRLRAPGLRDIRVVPDGSGRGASVAIIGSGGVRRMSGEAFKDELGLRSTAFTIRVLSLQPPETWVKPGKPVELRGFVRGLGRARLQKLDGGGWVVVRHVRPRANGRFVVKVRPSTTATYRLAYNGQAGQPVRVTVVR